MTPTPPASRCSGTRRLACSLLLVAGAARAAGVDPGQLAGFPGDTREAQLALEDRFAASLDASNLRTWLQALSAAPHHTGSPGGRRVAESLAAKLESWGFSTRIETFYALMSTPKERRVEMLAPSAFRAALEEPPIPGRTPADVAGSLPPYNVYSRDGDVTADAVYVNYGLREDYERLAALGVSVKGKIVVARYGQAFRGIKPRLAGENAAVGVLLYSDPADAGYARGVVYPDGPFLPLEGYQRGSVLDITRFTGDPLTPGKGATQKHRSPSMAKISGMISRVPVLPLSARDVQPILAAMTGPVAPPEWRGALPMTYRLGGNVKVRLRLSQDWTVVPLHNVVARLEGSTWPDEWVLRGNNHDAWNYGALVAGSGLVAMLEEARAIGSLARTGWRPKRTLIYLAWDGEEQGLLGSTEWAETHATELRAKAVSYLNSGITTQGFLAAGGSHVLETLVNDVASRVKDPMLGVSARDRVAALARRQGSADDRPDPAASQRMRLAPLGLGSDWTPFLQHLGIASLDFAFEGEADSGVYHSIYDNFDFYDRFGDPGYRYGVALAEANGRTMLRLANAEVLPFDFAGTAHAVKSYVGEISALVDEMRQGAERHNADVDAGLYRLAGTVHERARAPAKREAVPRLDFSPLELAAARLGASAERFLQARRSLERSPSLDSRLAARVNAHLRRTEQRLAPERGLPGRPWYRHHLYAPGAYTGYGVKTLPSLREAVERRAWNEARSEISAIAGVLGSYAAEIDGASEILESGAVRPPNASRGGSR
jgi:N-acetylated-alpha-linked acidic dipeptidase